MNHFSRTASRRLCPAPSLLVVLLLLLPALAVRAQDNAAFVSQNVPTAMVAGQQYSVSVTMQNTGSTTWTDGNKYRLGSSNPQENTTWNPPGSRVSPTLNVPPGEKFTFAFLVTAPQAATTYNFQWRMVCDSASGSPAWFGTASANVPISVTAPAGQPVRPQIARGSSGAVDATGSGSGDDDNKGSWTIQGSGVSVTSNTPGASGGWSVRCSAGGSFTIGVPNGAPVESYTVGYTTDVRPTSVNGADGEAVSGFSAAFDVIAAPPAPGPPPAATGTPYPWQSSVGGVNTANANKMVSLPLVGWTGRGGMPVGISLAFNSLAPANLNPTNAPVCAPKWTFNYEVFLVQSGATGASGSSVTITWGDGRCYTFVYNSTTHTYTPPAGIYDTLTANTQTNSFDLKTKGQTVYHFGNWNAAHYLTSIVDENGNTVTLARTSGARVTTVTDPSGRTLSLGYDGSARLSSVADNQTGRTWTLGYNNSGDLTQINWPALVGATPDIQMAYDGNHNLGIFTDLMGNAAWGAAYDGYSRPTDEADACGNHTLFDYSTGGSPKVTDSNGNVTTYVYSGGALQSVTDPLGHTESYFYDANYNLTQKTDRRGKVWTYGVDTKRGNAQTSMDPLKLDALVATVYDARNSKTLQTTDALGHTTTYVYDNAGINLLQTVDALGHTATVNAYSYGLPTSVSDALNDTSTMAYDGDGNLTSATDANGNTSSATYNRAGWSLTATDALGQTTGCVYDAWGRVIAVNALPAAGVPFYRLDSTGGDSYLTSSQGEYNSVRTGGGWNPVGPVGGIYANSTDAPGTVALYRMKENGGGDRYYTTNQSTYNTAVSQWGYADEGISGYVFTSSGPGRKPVFWAENPGVRDFYTDNAAEYNALASPWVKGGVAFYLVANTVSTTYDLNGNALTVTDPNGNSVTNTYDADNRLVTTTRANGDQVFLSYDADGGRTGLRGLLGAKWNGNNVGTGYAYTVRNELSTIGYPDGTHEYFDYDENGDLWHHTKKDGSVVTYTYDDDSRLSNTAYPAGTSSIAATANVGQSYYANGLPYQMTDGMGTTTWAYDAADRLTSLANPNQTLAYTYDDAGRLVNKNVSGYFAFSYQYDNAGRLTQQGTPQGSVAYAYDADGRLTGRTNGVGQLTTYLYNAAGQPAHVWWGSGSNPASIGWLDYFYDAGGRLAVKNENDGSSVAYGYDGAGQLTAETRTGGGPAYGAGYTYDHNGNRLTKTWNGQTDTYTYQPDAYNGNLHTDELLSVQGGVTGNRTFAYDQNGDLRSANANGYPLFLTPDYEDRYARFDFDTGPGRGGAYATETYNGLGARFARRSADGHQHGMALDGISPGDPPLYDSDGGSGGTLYTPGVAQTVGGPGGASRYALGDALGSALGMTDSSWSNTDDVRYEAFGGTVSHGGGSPTFLPLGFAASSGYQTDNDTGLMLLGNRYYDSTVGRFISPDPSGAGDNWYAYCRNNPLSYVDPSGLYEVDVYVTKWEETWNSQSKQWQEVPGSRYVDQEYSFQVPDDVNIAAMENKATSISAPGFYNWVKDNGDRHLPLRGPNMSLDVKQRGNQFQDAGNALFGVAAAKFGFPEEFALRMAGRAQVNSNTSRPGWGDPGNPFNIFSHGTPPYGDDPHDQALIKLGYGLVNPLGVTINNNVANFSQTSWYKF